MLFLFRCFRAHLQQ